MQHGCLDNCAELSDENILLVGDLIKRIKHEDDFIFNVNLNPKIEKNMFRIFVIDHVRKKET